MLERAPQTLSGWARMCWPYFLAAVLVAWTMFVLRSAHLQSGQVSSDWLLDYRFGFIRRGLSGELVWGLRDLFHLPALYLVAALQIGAFGVFVYGLWAQTRDVQLPLGFWMLAYSPATLVFSLFGLTEAGRKEVLLFALVSQVPMTLQLQGPQGARRAPFFGQYGRGLLLGVSASLIVLMHESLFFYVPWLVWLAWICLAEQSWGTKARFAGLIVIPPLVTFLGLLVFGGALLRHGFCQEFLQQGFSATMCQGILTFPIDSLRGSIENALWVIADYGYSGTYVACVALVLTPLVLALRAQNVHVPRQVLMGVLVCIVFSLPLFVVAVDWGRFIQIHLIMGMACWAASCRGSIEPPTEVALRGGLRSQIYGVLIVAGWVSMALWNMPVCCERGVGNGVLGHAAKVLRP